MTHPDRSKIIERIKAMRSLNQERGATEAEADTAIRMAQKLMADYQVSDTEIAASDYGRHVLNVRGVHLSRAKSHPFVSVGIGVQHIAGVNCYLSNAGLYIVGDEVGRELASYLFELTHDTLDREWKRERKARTEKANRMWAKAVAQHAPGSGVPSKLPRYADLDADSLSILRDGGLMTDKTARRSFMTGIAFRMSQRMQDMPPARACPDAVAKQIMSDKTERTDRVDPEEPTDKTALRAGFARGADVPISMGVTHTRTDMLKISGDGGAA